MLEKISLIVVQINISQPLQSTINKRIKEEKRREKKRKEQEINVVLKGSIKIQDCYFTLHIVYNGHASMY